MSVDVMRKQLFSFITIAWLLASGCSAATAQDKLTDAAIRHYFDEQMAAGLSFDAKPICDGAAAEYRQIDYSEFPGNAPDAPPLAQPKKSVYDKVELCNHVRGSMASLRAATAKGVKLNQDQIIDRITITPDGKSARVEYRSALSTDEGSIMESNSIETVILRDGKILTLGGEARSRVQLAMVEKIFSGR